VIRVPTRPRRRRGRTASTGEGRCRRSWAPRSPGTAARSSLTTSASRTRPTSRCTSAIPAVVIARRLNARPRKTLGYQTPAAIPERDVALTGW